MFVLAQDAGSSLTSLLPIILIGAVFYFLVIRPQRKRQKDRNAMLSELQVGSEVVTIGGLYGEVEALDDNWVDLVVSDDMVLRFTRSAIGRIATDEDHRDIEAFVTGEDPDDDVWPDDDEDATAIDASDDATTDAEGDEVTSADVDERS